MANVKNFHEQGGEKWVVDGTLELGANSTLDIKNGATLKGLPQAVKQEDSTASDVAGVVADLNALLTKLKNAGLMKA